MYVCSAGTQRFAHACASRKRRREWHSRWLHAAGALSHLGIDIVNVGHTHSKDALAQTRNLPSHISSTHALLHHLLLVPAYTLVGVMGQLSLEIDML